MTIKFTPSFDLTLGGRYSHNDQDVVQDVGRLAVRRGGATRLRRLLGRRVHLFDRAEVQVRKDGLKKKKKTRWPKFKLNDQRRMALYARVAKGFRPGGPNVIAPDAPAGTPTSYGSDSTSTTNWA